VADVAYRGRRGGGLTPLEHLEIPIGGGLVLDAVATGPADGPVVLLLHGFPQSSHEWRYQLPALAAAGYRAVAPDQRGYSAGARPDGVEAYHADHLVADVLAIVDRLGGAPVHLVGHDWGAIVAWLVAGRHPERLRSLTAVSVGHPLALAQAIATRGSDQAHRSAYVRFFQLPRVPEGLLLAGEGAGLRALFANTAFVDRTAMDVYVALLLEPGALTAVLNWYRALDVATLAGIGSVSVPTLYVWSTDDPALGRVQAEGTAAHVTGPYRFEELEGISHWIPEDAPDELNRLLLEHLAAAP
jgi:pimeloyl-ACP methyl ester carboxylesterase